MTPGADDLSPALIRLKGAAVGDISSSYSSVMSSAEGLVSSDKADSSFPGCATSDEMRLSIGTADMSFFIAVAAISDTAASSDTDSAAIFADRFVWRSD